MSRAPDAVAPRVWDLLLGIVVAVALTLIIATTPGGARSPDLIAYAFAVGFGALMLLRRRLPGIVLVVTALATFAYYILDCPPIGVAMPMVAALLSAAEAGLLLSSVGTAAVVFAVSVFYRLRDGVEPVGLVLGYELVSNLALMAATIAVGSTIRSRRVATAQRARIAELTSAQLQRETDLRVRSERERISRELHDTVGHTLSVIAVQAGVAQEAIGRDDDAAAEAVGRVREASRSSLTELRSMVRLLRESDDVAATDVLVSLAAVDRLLEAARATGLVVDADVDVADGSLSPSVDAAGYRVVQEALTNVIRHAHATRATVTAGLDDGSLLVRVSDDGDGPRADRGAGSGLQGMTERVRLLGGTFSADGAPGEGFVVEARIPARLEP